MAPGENVARAIPRNELLRARLESETELQSKLGATSRMWVLVQRADRCET